MIFTRRKEKVFAFVFDIRDGWRNVLLKRKIDWFFKDCDLPG